VVVAYLEVPTRAASGVSGGVTSCCLCQFASTIPREAAAYAYLPLLIAVETVHVNDAHTRPSTGLKALFAISLSRRWSDTTPTVRLSTSGSYLVAGSSCSRITGPFSLSGLAPTNAL
jgi:hypothetical protein